LSLASATLDAREEPLAIRVSPVVASAPASVVVRTMLYAHPQNRTLEVVIDSNEFYRSSSVQLDGDRAPRTATFEFRSLPRGSYEVRATLLDMKGEQRAVARQHIDVIAGGAGR
jgi:hypothetical protein